MSLLNLLTPFIQRIRSKAHAEPLRDWVILSAITVVILAGVVTWNLWTFGAITGPSSIEELSADTRPALSPSALNTIQNIFEARAAEEARYETGVYSFSDPSQ